MIPDSANRLVEETVGEGWTLSRPRDGWAETAFVAERDGLRLFVKTKVLVPILRRLAELDIVPPLIASGEFDGTSFIIQEFVGVPYPEHSWFADHLVELARLIRTYQQDMTLNSLLAARELTYPAEDVAWIERCFGALIETYGEHAPLQAAYTRLLEQLSEVRGAPVAPTHGDLSRKNLLPTYDRIYLVDWDEVSLSDPMRDVGPLLWWYVPPARWPEFFRTYGRPLGDGVIERAYWWSARTSLEVAHGLLEHGYLSRATDFLIDFLAAVDRQENPHARYGRAIVGSPYERCRAGSREAGVMPTLHLIYGFTGAGKRTFARQLEQEVRGVRSSPDEWMVALYGTDPPVQYFQAFRARTIQVIWDLAARVLQLGLDVILDFGFWTRASRDDARARARALGVAWKLYLLDCSEEVMRRRVLERTARMPAGALVIDEAAFELFKSRFEPLALDEEHTRIQTDDWDTDGSGRGVRLANAAMATLFLICGLPGSGKTRLAKQLELSRPALRLSPDEWIALLLSDLTDTAERDRLRSPVESLQWEVARRVLALGIDVVLEWGFWSREERARYRVQAEQLGARVELRYLAVERDELWARLSRRNANLPPVTFAVTEDQLDLWWSLFEPPSADELGLQS